VRGDFGVSIVTRGKPALEIIWERVPNTLLLMIPAQIVILVFGLIVGIYSALRQYSWVDNSITTLSFVGFSMPIFLIALLSIYSFRCCSSVGACPACRLTACLIPRWARRRPGSQAYDPAHFCHRFY
jgi:ABC-type dipeptide/oligopeptide/nickel transport system permease component